MPNIDQTIAARKASLNPKVNAILPSEGIPGKTGSGSSSLTAWTEIAFFPDGATKNGRVVSGNGVSSSTWVLPLPMDLSEPNSLQYEPIEFGNIARIGAKLLGNNKPNQNIDGDVEKAETGLLGMDLSGFAAQLGISLGEELLGYFINQQAVNFLRGTLRNTANPNMENLFKTSNLRTFQFSWNLTPLQPSDASGIKTFIDEVKTNIYPLQVGALGWTRLKFPSEFQITFYASTYGGGTPIKIFQTAPCVCTDFVTQYTPNGAFNTHIDGRPSSVAINATFQEMYSLHRGDIEELSRG
jgi:hypothetical protein